MANRGEATIQFLRNKDHIAATLDELYFIKNTHTALTEDGTINFSYEQFRALCNKFLRQKENPDKRSIKKQHSERSNTQPIPSTATSAKSFRRETRVIHNPTMTDERKKEMFGE